MMITRVHKWGNSLGLRIPKTFAVEAHLASGAPVDLTVRDGILLVAPVRPPAYGLADLLSKVTADNVQGSIDTGSACGRESW
jgi:antitoxin MazE